MTITFTRDGDYPGARIVARSGRVFVGAVFPPLGRPGGKWRWRLWLSVSPQEGVAASDLAARNDLLTAWEELLRAAGLQQIEATQ